jgi:hypothetical protein
MSSIKEMAIQCKQLDAQITKAAQKAFKDCSEAGLVLEEHWPSGVWEPAYDYKYSDHEIDATGIDIQGHKYIGGGEYADARVHVTFEAFEDFDTYIGQKKAEHAAAKTEKAAEKAAYDEEERLKEEEREKQCYLKLKAKYEGEKL